MRVPVIVALAFFGLLPETIAAQEIETPAVVERVISANPELHGKAYVLSVMLKDGRRLSFEIPPAEAVKIVDGLSKAAGSDSQKHQVVALVQSMSIQADAQGRAVVLQPRTSAGPLESLAIPIEGADRFVQLFQQKAAETRANATKMQQQK
jgi:hypothetical protein